MPALCGRLPDVWDPPLIVCPNPGVERARQPDGHPPKAAAGDNASTLAARRPTESATSYEPPDGRSPAAALDARDTRNRERAEDDRRGEPRLRRRLPRALATDRRPGLAHDSADE